MQGLRCRAVFVGELGIGGYMDDTTKAAIGSVVAILLSAVFGAFLIFSGTKTTRPVSDPALAAMDLPLTVEQSVSTGMKEAIDHETYREWQLYREETEETDIPEVGETVSDAEYEEPYVEEIEYWEPGETATYEYGDPGNFRESGVVYSDGVRYTYYSQNVLPGGGLVELNSNGRHVGDDGFVYDGDGYIAVASSDYEKGTVIDTPWGEAKVYDSGCASGTVDMYTDF